MHHTMRKKFFRQALPTLRTAEQSKLALFEQWALPHKDYIYTACLSLTRVQEDAEDLAQETFLRALRFFHLIALMWIITHSHIAQADDSTLAQYFPLAPGNRWVYEVQDRTDGAPPAAEYWEVIREDQGAYVLRIRHSDLPTGGFEESFIPTDDGIKRVAVETKDKEHPPFFLKGPLRKGTHWEDDDGTFEITALNKTITVPAGTFSHCLEVTQSVLVAPVARCGCSVLQGVP